MRSTCSGRTTSRTKTTQLTDPKESHSGICRNEMLKLMKDCVRLHLEHGADGKISGELIIKRGLKRRARKRKLVIDQEMKKVLERLLKDSQCDYASRARKIGQSLLGPGCWRNRWAKYGRRSRPVPMPACTLCRHTFLTEAGEYRDHTDPARTTRTPLRCSTSPDTITLKPRCATYTRAGGCGPEPVCAAGGLAATRGAYRVQEVGAKSGAAGNALTGRTC
jgi:hypothetical protein